MLEIVGEHGFKQLNGDLIAAQTLEEPAARGLDRGICFAQLDALSSERPEHLGQVLGHQMIDDFTVQYDAWHAIHVELAEFIVLNEAHEDPEDRYLVRLR